MFLKTRHIVFKRWADDLIQIEIVWIMLEGNDEMSYTISGEETEQAS